MKIKEALRSISSRLSNPVFFLKGDDYFLQEFFIKKVSKQFFGNNKYSRTLMLPDDMKGKEIIERLITTDLFETNKLFIIRNAQRIVGKPSNDLLEICKNPNSNHLLFLIIDDWFSKTSFISKIESFIEPVDTQTPFDKDMKKWAKYLINEQNKSADYRVISYLIDIAGDSLVHLNNEINKICISIGKRKNIEVEDLEQFLGWRRERQLWEFLLALGNKNFEKSIEIGKSLIDKNILLLSLIIPLTNLFQEMLFSKMKKDGTFSSHRGYIALPTSVKSKIKYFSSNFSEEEIQIAIKLLYGIDKRQKSQTTDDEAELIQFIGRVIG